MLKERGGQSLTRPQLAELREELERERRRVERSLSTGDTSSEHHEIVKALERLDEGTYGTCVKCEQPIPYGRLSVMPATEHCVGCGL